MNYNKIKKLKLLQYFIKKKYVLNNFIKRYNNNIKKNIIFNNIKPNIIKNNVKPNIIQTNRNIVIYTPGLFTEKIGGINVLYYLGKLLEENGKNVRMYCPKYIKNNNKNPYFNKYYKNDFDITEAIVIYPEIISGNPLNSKYVIRWILAPIGLNTSKDIYKSWNNNDLLYYFNNEKRFEDDNILDNKNKLLPLLIINPFFKNYNINRNNNSCFTYRKSNIHKKIINIHPNNSFEIKKSLPFNKLVFIFNTYKYFYSYDALTFLTVLSALCGCISIVYPIEGVSKLDWLKMTAAYPYLKENNIDYLYGISYGLDDIEFAKNTSHLAKEQWENILDFNKKKYFNSFLTDIENINIFSFANTVKNINNL
jgi:hypothetical protein